MPKGLSIDYYCEKLDNTDVTWEDVDFIYEALEKAIHERNMTFGGGMVISLEGEDNG